MIELPNLCVNSSNDVAHYALKGSFDDGSVDFSQDGQRAPSKRIRVWLTVQALMATMV